jgi:hypothetical protein
MKFHHQALDYRIPETAGDNNVEAASEGDCMLGMYVL